VLTVGHLSLNAPLLATTGAFALVYAVGTAAALRLLPRGTWVRRGAAVGFVATLGLLALTGTHLLGPALIGVGALAWTAVRRGARPAAPAPV
jgi:amino acid efflux transporter